uniref:Uncharacterized protein n=2 Tax=Myzomyia TaxID=59140 RepID=A0A182MA99_9DIPT
MMIGKEQREEEWDIRAGLDYETSWPPDRPVRLAAALRWGLIMKVAICLFAVIALALAAPQRDGGALTDEAIRQAQSQQLIPQDAQIQGVQQGIQVAALESIPGSQRVDLFQLLGDQVPREVITNLQSQVDQVGQV